MIAVIFQVTPKDGKADAYFDKQEIFADYRISVAEVVRDYTMADRI